MTGVPLIAYLALSLLMFTIGAIGVVIRRNPIVIFMCIELMLNAANLAFLSFARYAPWQTAMGQPGVVNPGDVKGQAVVVFVMAVAAAEVAVGLGILMAIFRLRDKVDVDDLNTLNG